MNQHIKGVLTLAMGAAIGLGMSGCTPKDGCVAKPKEVCNTKIDEKDRQIAALHAAIEEARKQQSKTIIKEVVVPTGNELYPPNAKPGECYARVLIPAQYRLETEKVLKKEAGEKVRVIPAKYRWVTKKVMVKEPGEKIVTIPPTYKTVKEKVLVREGSEKVVTIPPVYKTVTEKVLVKPAHTIWKRGRGPIEKVDNLTGEIMCLVKVPALYKTITKKVLVSPATTKTVKIPPVYKTITKKVIDKPATTKTVKIPPVYKTVRVKELVEPARVEKITIPPIYQTITKKIKVADAQVKWKRILCKTNMNRATIVKLQKALKKAGFNPGPIDGIYGWRTNAAVTKFQKAKGLSSGALTMETLEALHVI